MVVGGQRWSSKRLAHGIPLAYSPDGRRLVVEEPGAVAVWDVASATPLRTLPVSNPGFGATTRPGFVAEFDPGGTVVALLDATERPAKLLRWQWDSANRAQVIGNYGSDGVALVGWSGTAIHFIVRDHLEAWDGDEEPRVLAAVPTHTADIDRAAYLSPTNILLTFGEGTRLWDLTAKTVTDVLPDDGSSEFALSSDRAVLAISGDDGFVHVWDRRPEDPAFEIARYSVAPYIALNGDGSRLAVADTSVVTVMPVRFAGPMPAVIELARKLVARQLTPTEKAKLLPG
jgi:WD40 repeat protein